MDLHPGLVVVDGTIGAGGHAGVIAETIGAGGRLIGLDRDPEILARARESLERLAGDARARAGIHLHRARFSELEEVLAREGLAACDRVLLDLGVSSWQLDQAARGFSFHLDGPLDMRMDPDSSLTAAGWLARVPEAELADALWRYGEERYSRRIARAIVAARQRAPLVRTLQLADLIVQAMPGPARRQRIHPATRSFQAIRIVVNDELGQLSAGLEAAWRVLVAGGRLVVLSFHSLEDRIVKQFLRERMLLPHRKPIVPTAGEIADNPRARSAKLRTGIKPAAA
jgi:16S rRNA (cytosine1402-N4)-methyltransferase